MPPYRCDPVTGAPVWLDRAQPLYQVNATLALLRVWRLAEPRQVWWDVYGIEGTPCQWLSLRN